MSAQCNNKQHRPDLCRCTMEKDELVKDVVYIYTKGNNSGVRKVTRQLLHSFDNSIIFVYSYYINAKLYLLKVFKFIKLTEFLKDSVDNKTVKLTQDYLYLMGHISTPFTPFT